MPEIASFIPLIALALIGCFVFVVFKYGLQFTKAYMKKIENLSQNTDSFSKSIEKGKERGHEWGGKLTERMVPAVSSGKFHKTKSAMLLGAFIGALFSTFIFCIHNRDTKLDVFDFSAIQLVLIGVLTLAGTGFFYKYQNKKLRYFCSERTILFWAALVLLGDGFEIFNTKTIYYQYYRQQGSPAQVFGLVEMLMGIYSIYLGLSYDKIKEKLKRV